MTSLPPSPLPLDVDHARGVDPAAARRKDLGDEVSGTILIADDDRASRKLLRRLLEQDGHSVRAAADGAEALELFAEEAIDIVLLDIVMPELDGISVLERLKETPDGSHVPVIMISAVDEIESVVRCIEAGADDYLPKPFNPVILRARINAGLSKRRLHDLERARVHDVFSRFLPEHVVDDVLERTDDDLRLGGVGSVGTVMFTDIRGFTAFSENRPPELVIEALNHYFDETSDAILEHGGTLVAYRGDGFLAVFGAPIEVDDHADRALATARDMVDARLPRFNAWLQLEWPRRGGVDGRGPEQRALHVRKRRLAPAARVHRARRHRQHRVAHRAADEDARRLDPPVGLHAHGAPPRARRPPLAGGSGRARPPVGRRPVDRRRLRPPAVSCG